MTNPERLALAEQLVREVMATLTTTTHQCPSCHLQPADNWSELQAHQQLEAIANKLAKWKVNPIWHSGS